MSNIFYFILAALFEFASFYLFWAHSSSDKSIWITIAAITCQFAFWYVVKKIDKSLLRKAYILYSSIFIVSTLLWMYKSENFSPDTWDYILVGSALTGIMILCIPRIK